MSSEPEYVECTCGHYVTDHDSEGCAPECGCVEPGVNRCTSCGSERVKVTPSGRRYCIPCRRAHEKRRKARKKESR